ncbi:hypothetical protein BGX34_001230 [Mortierella sp. NVP85]|nr:hypothetical protein BGX34_001230 [Mortierella sp. NVP85]
MTKGMHPRQPQPQPLQQQQQQQQQQRTSPQPRRSKQSKQKSHLPGAPPYLRILFPRHVQLREPVPQLLNHPRPDLDAEAYHFLALLVRDFIQTWYTTFSNDPQFVASIVHVVIDIARKLERRSQEVDWVGLLLQDVPEVLKRHFMDYRQAAQKVETAYAPNQTIESIFHGLQPHFALRDGEESEIEYLRQLSDEILRVLLPEGEYQSDCVRWLVREILCCLILRGLVEILTEPDMVNYIVNVLLVDFEPTDEKYEEFLRKAADKIETSDDNFAAFLASLETYKGGSRLHIHRSSTPNIQSTDEMVTMLQDAQSTVLERQRHTQSPLARAERNDSLLAQRISGSTAPRYGRTPPPPPYASSNGPSSETRYSTPSHHVPSLESPLQIPIDNKKDERRRPALRASSSSSASTTNLPTGQPSRLGRMNSSNPTTASRIRSGAVWAMTVAPTKYTSYMINNFLIPFGAMMAVFLNFMLTLPNKVHQVSQAVTWIYTELEAPEQTELETGIFKLVKEVFYLEERNPVVWRQWEIMGWPLIRTLGGGAIDRYVDLLIVLGRINTVER